MKKAFASIVSAALLIGAFGAQPAFSFGLGSNARAVNKNADVMFIKAKQRALEPFAHVLFCTKLPSECRASGGQETVELSASKRRELNDVNRRVNRQIVAVNDSPGAMGGDVWSLAPTSGDCEDFAITKRHELIRRGWSPSALRLAEARTAWGEGHLVLVVRTSEGDLVLDNLTSRVRNWRQTGLSWIMIQASGNPRIWHRV
jgi:predicted transglutaminase-like cysteine proteinase